MDRESDGGPILTRRTLTACLLAWGLISCITGFQLGRDGAGPGHIALAVFFIGAFMFVALLLAYFLAVWARRHRYARREPIVMAVALLVVWTLVSAPTVFAMIRDAESPRRIFLIVGSTGALVWVGAALAYAVAIRLRRRPDDEQ